MIQRPNCDSAWKRWIVGAPGQYFFAAVAATSVLLFFSCCWKSYSWEHTEASLKQLASYLNSTEPVSLESARKAASVMDPLLMSTVPEKFLPNYKSPCWMTSKKKSSKPVLQCLPYLYILGGFHSGCLSLQQKLSVHPRMAMGKLSNLHFWSEDKVTAEEYLEAVDELIPDVQKYPQEMVIADASQSHFAFYWAEAERTHREFRRVMMPCWNNCTRFYSKKKEQLGCLQTSCFPMSRSADKFLSEDLNIPYRLVHTPVLLRAAYGDQKLPRFVVVLRDPVARLWSGFNRYLHYKQQYGHHRAGFNKYINEQLASFHRCSRKHGVVDCVLYFEAFGLDEETTFFHADQLLRGVYSVYVELWLKYFPRETFLFIKAEDFYTKTNETLSAVLEHVGLSRPSAKVWANMVRGYVPPRLPDQGMDPETIAKLRAFYAPFNKRLGQLLGPDFSWE